MITAVTAYVPIQGHPRPEEEYRKLGLQLLCVKIPLMFRHAELEECWLYQYLNTYGSNKEFTCSVSDNPQKNSIAYHIVQAQKSEWLADAALDNPDADVLVWIDYGIFHVPGVTGEIIRNFIVRAANERTIAIPGCWDEGYRYDDDHPCWRFCGGVWVVPRQYVVQLDNAMKFEYIRWLKQTNNISWEVNALARLERSSKGPPIWHYKVDTHDSSMFTAYRPAEARQLQ